MPLVTAGIAMIMDIRSARVENGWLLLMLGTGFLARIYTEGWKGIPVFAAGVLFPFVVLIILYIFRMLGPGDIKLLCVLGGMIGVRKTGMLMLSALFLGGMLSFLILIFCCDIKERIRYLLSYIADCIRTGTVKAYYKTGMPIENFHFTVPIFLSTVLYAGGIF